MTIDSFLKGKSYFIGMVRRLIAPIATVKDVYVIWKEREKHQTYEQSKREEISLYYKCI